MFSYEDRLRAVHLYIKLGKRVALTIRQLGYPTSKALKSWYREYEQHVDLRAGYVRRQKFSQEQKELASNIMGERPLPRGDDSGTWLSFQGAASCLDPRTTVGASDARRRAIAGADPRGELVAEHAALAGRHKHSVLPEHGPGAAARNVRRRFAEPAALPTVVPAPADAVEIRDLAVYEQTLEAA
jgi:hypothetical protein